MDYRPEFLDIIARRRAVLRTQLVDLLPSNRAIVWEVGCGHGHFLVQYAQAFPQKFCVGIDLRLERLERSGRKRDRAQAANCHFLRAEAREFFHALPQGSMFEEIWVLFPDPWPKARHSKNRLLKAEFFEAVANRAAPGAKFYFRTDDGPYFSEVQRVLGGLRTWQVDPGAIWPFEPATVFQERAPSYQSLTAVRTSHPATPTEIVAPGLPPRAEPTSPA